MRGFFLFFGLVLATTFASAQDRAALIADRISLTASGGLRAEGNVEVLFQGLRLRATAIVYDAQGSTISIEGPMSLADAEGDIVFLASEAQLSDDFRNGLMTSARLVLNQQLQLAGNEIRRVDGRYTHLFQAVASSCAVCDSSDTPLWQIRASRVTHDQLKRRIYYENAVFEVSGFPVFFVPRLRMPDASVERASGFLIPSLNSNSVLGSGMEIPYFQTLGDHADVLVTPYVAANTTTLGVRYRQLFQGGAVRIDGAVSDDDLFGESLRGYLFGSGVFFLPRDYELRFDVETASDSRYLFDYGISDQDRLRNTLALNRTRRESHFNARADAYRSFRDTEVDGTLPARILLLDYVRAFEPPLLGGRGQVRAQAHTLARPSSVDIDGRDYARMSAGLDWSRVEVFGPGIRFETQAKFDLDHYEIAQDSTSPGDTTLTSVIAADVSLPLVRTTPTGATDLVTPRLQFVLSDASAASVPNEESTLVEFDEGALFALDRLPGATEYEIGNRINAGITWHRQASDGRSGGVTLGRVFRTEAAAQFNAATGLSGMQSDWLVATRLQLGPNFSFDTRSLFGDNMKLNRGDVHLGWRRDVLELDANFLWHVAEPEVGRDLDTWELHAGARFPLGRNWAGNLDMRYDFATGRAASAGLVLTYSSRCITANLGFDRTFTSSSSAVPKTDFTINLSVPTAPVASKRPALQCQG